MKNIFQTSLIVMAALSIAFGIVMLFTGIEVPNFFISLLSIASLNFSLIILFLDLFKKVQTVFYKCLVILAFMIIFAIILRLLYFLLLGQLDKVLDLGLLANYSTIVAISVSFLAYASNGSSNTLIRKQKYVSLTKDNKLVTTKVKF